MEDPKFDDAWLDELFAEIDRLQALKPLRKEHPYVADLIRELLPYEDGLSRQMVLHDLERQRKKSGLPIPSKFEQAVQSSYNQYCEDSLVFKRRNLPTSEALFYSPGGKGSGKWAVHRERAEAWLKARIAEART